MIDQRLLRERLQRGTPRTPPGMRNGPRSGTTVHYGDFITSRGVLGKQLTPGLGLLLVSEPSPRRRMQQTPLAFICTRQAHRGPVKRWTGPDGLVKTLWTFWRPTHPQMWRPTGIFPDYIWNTISECHWFDSIPVGSPQVAFFFIFIFHAFMIHNLSNNSFSRLYTHQLVIDNRVLLLSNKECRKNINAAHLMPHAGFCRDVLKLSSYSCHFCQLLDPETNLQPLSLPDEGVASTKHPIYMISLTFLQCYMVQCLPVLSLLNRWL